MKKWYLDITQEHCPMTFVKARLKLDEMEVGDELEIKLTEGEPLENVPKSIEEHNCKILSINKVGPYYSIRVRK